MLLLFRQQRVIIAYPLPFPLRQVFAFRGAGFRLRLLEKETKRPVRTALGRALWVLTALAFPAVIVVFRGVVLLQA